MTAPRRVPCFAYSLAVAPNCIHLRYRSPSRNEASHVVSSWCIPLRRVSCRISPAAFYFGCLGASRNYVHSRQLLDHFSRCAMTE
jgi:hypothetical protein